jgi:hypothetical protein
MERLFIQAHHEACLNILFHRDLHGLLPVKLYLLSFSAGFPMEDIFM